MITEEHLQELDALLKACIENEGTLSDWESSFINEWVDKVEVYQTALRITEKQQAIFDRLQDKLEKKGVL